MMRHGTDRLDIWFIYILRCKSDEVIRCSVEIVDVPPDHSEYGLDQLHLPSVVGD
jgi:hypothetical protein